MNVLVAAALLGAADADANAAVPTYPSCDLKTQHALRSDVGGSVTDPRQAHIAARANILEADLGTARKARVLTQAEADRLYKRVEAARIGANRYTAQQGFLSAGETASYDRELDAVAMQVCGRGTAIHSKAGMSGDSKYLQDRAATLDRRIEVAARRRELARRDATTLRLAVRQVQTEAGHLQAVNGNIGRLDADRMNQKLTNVERILTHQP